MNSVPERSFSADSGFVLSDALIAVAVVSALALLACSAMNAIRITGQKTAEAYQQSDASYSDVLYEIGECICEQEEMNEEPAEEPTATS